MKKHFIVYKTTNLTTLQYYIGVHGQVKDDDYLGSGVRLKSQIKKYGKSNFSRETLFVFNSEPEAFSKEIELLKDCVSDDLCINISLGGDGGPNFLGKTHSEETRKKLSESAAKRTHSEETRAKISEINKNRSPEIRKLAAKKLSERYKAGEIVLKPYSEWKKSEGISTSSRVDYSHSSETKEELSVAAKKRFENPEERRKSARNWTDEQKVEWGKTQKEKWTPEMRNKLSNSLKGVVPWNKKLLCGHIQRDKCSCDI